jgi:hypothetical protein
MGYFLFSVILPSVVFYLQSCYTFSLFYNIPIIATRLSCDNILLPKNTKEYYSNESFFVQIINRRRWPESSGKSFYRPFYIQSFLCSLVFFLWSCSTFSYSMFRVSTFGHFTFSHFLLSVILLLVILRSVFLPSVIVWLVMVSKIVLESKNFFEIANINHCLNVSLLFCFFVKALRQWRWIWEAIKQ